MWEGTKKALKHGWIFNFTKTVLKITDQKFVYLRSDNLHFPICLFISRTIG